MEVLQNFPADYLKTLSHHFRQFHFIGFYMFDDPTKSWLSRFGRVTFTIIYFLFCTTSQLLFSFCGQEQGASFFEIIIPIPFSILYVQAFAKLPLLLYHKEELKRVIQEIAELWPRDIRTNQEKAAVMKSRLSNLKVVDTFLFVFSWSGLTTCNIVPTVFTVKSFWDEQRTYALPIQMWFPWETDSLPKWLLSMFVQISYSAPLYLSLNLATELLLLNLTCDLGLLFRLLQIDLEKMITVKEENPEDGDLDDRIEVLNAEDRNDEKIKNLFKTHQRLLSIVDRLNSIFGIIIFNATFSSSILICLFCFLGLTAKGLDMVMYILSMIGMVFTIFNFSWPGQKLLDDSLGIADAAYKAFWYKRDLKFRKYIVIIMQRAQQPCFLTALGFTNMTYDTLVTVFKTAFSYLSLLRQVYEEQ